MAYNIYKADGTEVQVPDNAISNEFYNPSANGAGKGTGLQLVGRNVVGYGAAIAQDLLQMTTNFASLAAPSDITSMQGQLWFNLNDLTLYIRSNPNTGGAANWKQIGANSGPLIGEPLFSTTGTLLGYSTQGVPANELTSAYVPLSSIAGYFAGWLRVSSGLGMTAEFRAPDNSLIGYAFPA